MLVDPGDPSGAGEASLAAAAEVALGVSFPFLFIGLRVLGALETDGMTCCCIFDVTPASSCPAYHIIKCQKKRIIEDPREPIESSRRDKNLV